MLSDSGESDSSAGSVPLSWETDLYLTFYAPSTIKGHVRAKHYTSQVLIHCSLNSESEFDLW